VVSLCGEYALAIDIGFLTPPVAVSELLSKGRAITLSEVLG
jgi:hypothetical protein